MRLKSPAVRKSASIAIAAVVVSSLAACASADAKSSSASHDLVVWDAHGPLFAKAIAPVVTAFEKANPTIKVKIQPVDWTTFQQRVLSAAAGAQLPCVMYSNTQVESAIATSNVMAPVNTSIIGKDQLAQYLPAFKKGLQDVHGTQLFVPFLGGANQIYVRTNGAAGATIPTTYSEWIAWAKKNTKMSGSTVSSPGLGWRYDVPGNTWLPSEFMELVLAANGQFLDGDNGPTATKALFNTAAGKTALQFMHDSIWIDKVALPPSQVNQPKDNAISNFVSGKEASSYLGPWLPNAVATLQGAAAGFKSTWDAAYLIPKPDVGGKDVTVISTDGWGVPKTCANAPDAWNFIKFMTSKDSMITFFKVFQHPVARTDAMLSADVAQLMSTDMAGASHELDLWKNPAISAAAVPEMNHKYNADLFTAITKDIVSYLNDAHGDTSATLNTLESDVNQVLKNG